jgi:hypothetical protein
LTASAGSRFLPAGRIRRRSHADSEAISSAATRPARRLSRTRRSALADSARASPWLAAGHAGAGPWRTGPESFVESHVRRGCCLGRSGDFLLVLRPYVFLGSDPDTRGDHRAPYPFDTHVPLVLHGWGIRPGVHAEPVSSVDIAPTVSGLLGIECPAQCEGQELSGALVRSAR